MSVVATGFKHGPGMGNVRAHASNFSSLLLFFFVDEMISLYSATYSSPIFHYRLHNTYCSPRLFHSYSYFYCFGFFTSRTVMYLVNVATEIETINSDLG